jgi:hypothetical protein
MASWLRNQVLGRRCGWVGTRSERVRRIHAPHRSPCRPRPLHSRPAPHERRRLRRSAGLTRTSTTVLCQFDAVPHGVQSASWIRSLQGTEGAAAWGSAPSRQSGSRVRPPLPRGRFDHPRLHLTVSKIGTLSTAFPGGPDAGFSLTTSAWSGNSRGSAPADPRRATGRGRCRAGERIDRGAPGSPAWRTSRRGRRRSARLRPDAERVPGRLRANRGDVNAIALEGSPLAPAIIAIAEQGGLRGTRRRCSIR